MAKIKKYTTFALSPNQYLSAQYPSSIVETYCIGYTDNKRDKTLDGHYFTKELSEYVTTFENLKIPA